MFAKAQNPMPQHSVGILHFYVSDVIWFKLIRFILLFKTNCNKYNSKYNTGDSVNQTAH